MGLKAFHLQFAAIVTVLAGGLAAWAVIAGVALLGFLVFGATAAALVRVALGAAWLTRHTAFLPRPKSEPS